MCTSERVRVVVQGLSDLCNVRLRNDDVQDFDTRWDQALLSASEIPEEMILDGFFKSKLQESVQLQPALAMYEQENVRNNGQPSYSRLKTAVRRHAICAENNSNDFGWF